MNSVKSPVYLDPYTHLTQSSDLVNIEAWNQFVNFACLAPTELPTHVVIDDFFTEYFEEIVIEFSKEDESPWQTSPIAPVVHAFHTLSATACNDIGIAKIMNTYKDASGEAVHVDTLGGHAFLANFDVQGRPYYNLWTRQREELQSVNSALSVPYNMADPEIVPIESRQLVIINGIGTVAVNASGKMYPSTIPHEAVVHDGDRRTLMMSYVEPL